MGIVNGDKKVKGMTFAHCWIEINKDIMMDLSNNKCIVTRMEKLKHRIEETTVKYSPEEYCKLAIKHGHYGPFERKLFNYKPKKIPRGKK